MHARTHALTCTHTHAHTNGMERRGVACLQGTRTRAHMHAHTHALTLTRTHAYAYVHSDSRNSLTSKHATDLVWLYSNLRLLKRTQALEQGGKAVPWMAVAEEEEEGVQQQEGSSSGEGEDSNDEEQA